VDKKNM